MEQVKKKLQLPIEEDKRRGKKKPVKKRGRSSDTESPEEEDGTDNIDFELMEPTLREEEEYRQKLEDDNQKLQLNVSNLKEEIQRLKDNHIEEVSLLKKSQNDNICIVKKELHQKVEKLINELAESSMRCARQQDTIEQRQLKIDELLKEINDQKDDISKLFINFQRLECSDRILRCNQ